VGGLSVFENVFATNLPAGRVSACNKIQGLPLPSGLVNYNSRVD
jgi:hypothetical protein